MGFLTKSQRKIVNRHAPGIKWFDFDSKEFGTDYNKLAFSFNHSLHENELFELESIYRLCSKLPKDLVKIRTGKVPKDTNFDSSLMTFASKAELADDFSNVVEDQLYIAIYNPEINSDYRALILGLLQEIAAAKGDVDGEINWYSSYIFVSAMQTLTPYHMDREMNFLSQIRGEKKAKLWDPQDDDVMSEADRDRLFGSYSEDARPIYHPGLESKAKQFDLRPGMGIHYPLIAPHLIETKSEISISFALTYRTERSDMWSNAHRMNYKMRQLGLQPSRVGPSILKDWIKSKSFQMASGTRKALRFRSGDSSSS